MVEIYRRRGAFGLVVLLVVALTPPAFAAAAGSGAAAAPAYAGVGNIQRARLNYILHCQGCHLPDGSGFVGKVPNMKGYVGNFLQVEGGREFLVRVPGSATTPLGDAALAELLNWMLFAFSAAQIPESFAPYSAAEVGRLRVRPLQEVEKHRAVLVSNIERATAGARQ